MGRERRSSSFDKPRRAQQARLKLRCHPETPSGVDAVEVQIARGSNGRVTLDYLVLGDVNNVVWPAPTDPSRADRLWEATCFELFVKTDGRIAYYEFNFSPSRQWAAYRFSDTREAMQLVQRLSPPAITCDQPAVSVSLDIGGLPALSAGVDWPVAISAVIEVAGGVKSYWALQHPPGKPDFHHPDCFALHLAPPALA